MTDPVINDTARHYAALERNSDKHDAIYQEAMRLVNEETSEVLSEIYSDIPMCARFEVAVRKIATNFSTSQQMAAVDVISELMHETAMKMATKQWEIKHGMV